MQKKVLFFDFDGTIISNKTGILPDSAREVLKKLKEAGYVLILNTGRTKAILNPITDEIAFDGRILGCGSYVEYQGEVIYEAEVEKKIHKEIIDTIKECDIEAFFEGKECLYISDKVTSERLLNHLDEYEKNGVEILSVSNDMNFQKIFIHYNDLNYIDHFKTFMEPYFEYIDRGGNCAELVMKGHSKATGIEKIMEQLHVNKEDCYVFGDSNNDIPMFEIIKNSILIGGESPELKHMVMYVSSCVEEDGLYKAVYECGLLKKRMHMDYD